MLPNNKSMKDRTMIVKRILDKLKIWGEAPDGIDDVRGEKIFDLERRLFNLEREMERVRDLLPPEFPIERELALHNLNRDPRPLV
jgi:hypothetical protein